MITEDRIQKDQAYHRDPSVIAYRKQREREERQREKDVEQGRRRRLLAKT